MQAFDVVVCACLLQCSQARAHVWTSGIHLCLSSHDWARKHNAIKPECDVMQLCSKQAVVLRVIQSLTLYWSLFARCWWLVQPMLQGFLLARYSNYRFHRTFCAKQYEYRFNQACNCVDCLRWVHTCVYAVCYLVR
jgi:hypothetical protein